MNGTHDDSYNVQIYASADFLFVLPAMVLYELR